MAWYDFLSGGVGNALGGLLSGGAYYNQMQDLSQFGSQAQTGAEQIGQQAADYAAFKPYTMTTATGGSTGVDASGNIFSQLSGAEQGLQNQYQGLAGQFGTQAGSMNPMFSQQASYLNQMGMGYAPSQFTRQGLSNYNVGVNTNLGQSGAQRISDTVSPYGFGNAGVNALGNQALQMGQQGLAQAGQAGAQAQGLANQYAGLASQAAGNVMQDQTQREQDIYNRIRAAQSPEEQRQAMQLEQRLAAQGRLGVSTSQYGGTPEQLAQAKAQEEAKNSAMLSAMQQAGSERDRSLAEAQGLSSMYGSAAGLGSDLQSQAQQRASQLAQMGMSAQQINSQLQNEGLGRSLQSGEYNRQGAMLSDQLANSDFTRRLQAGEFGLRGQELASQLSSDALQRQISAGGFMNEQDRMSAAMRTQDIQNQLALMQGAQGALGGGAELQNLYASMGQGMLGSSYMPSENLMQQGQYGAQLASLMDAARRQGAGYLAETGMAGLDANLQAQLGRADLARQGISALSGMFGQLGSAQAGADSSMFSSILGNKSSTAATLANLLASGGGGSPSISSGLDSYLSNIGQDTSFWDSVLNTSPTFDAGTSGFGGGYGFGSYDTGLPAFDTGMGREEVNWFGG